MVRDNLFQAKSADLTEGPLRMLCAFHQNKNKNDYSTRSAWECVRLFLKRPGRPFWHTNGRLVSWLQLVVPSETRRNGKLLDVVDLSTNHCSYLRTGMGQCLENLAKLLVQSASRESIYQGLWVKSTALKCSLKKWMAGSLSFNSPPVHRMEPPWTDQ